MFGAGHSRGQPSAGALAETPDTTKLVLFTGDDGLDH